MERIKAYRQAHGMTQREFGKRLGGTQGAVSHWEKGEQISLKHLPKVAIMLNVPIAELIHEQLRAA